MAIVVVQTAGFAAAQPTPETYNAPSAFTVGNLAVVIAIAANPDTGGVNISSPAVASWTPVTTSTTSGSVTLYIGTVTTGGQTGVTVSTVSGNNNYPSADIMELSGVDPSTPVLTSGHAGLSANTNLDCPSLNATAAGQLYVGGGFHNNGVPTGNTPTAGFTALMGCTLSGLSYDTMLYAGSSGAGAMAPTIAASGANSGDVVAAIFQPAVGVPTYPYPVLPLFLMLQEEPR